MGGENITWHKAILYSPLLSTSVSASSEQSTDFAIIEIDKSRIDVSNFKGNVIDLDAQIPVDVFTCMV
jgi:hypothetical protein